MSRAPMTPERFQSRDVKRRLSKLERNHDYLKADFVRLTGRLNGILARIKEVDDYQYEG